MRLAIDASRTTHPQRTGTENYALQLIRTLLPLLSHHHVDLYFRDDPPAGLFPDDEVGFQSRVIPWPRLWTHLRLAAALWQSRPDVIWVPAHTLPRFFPGAAVVTVHDLGYRHFPEAHPDGERRYLEWSTHHSATRATRIMADSQATQADLTRFYDIPAHKIGVVYPGVDETLAPVRDETELARVRGKYGLPDRYFYFMGTLQPRKNIARLVKAFHHWQQSNGVGEVVLALGGKVGWLYDSAWTDGIPNVALLGYVDDADVAALYSGAIAFLFPSLYEGFGFPVLEAMRCETPVLCSQTSSLGELAAEAALTVDPLNVDAIAEGIRILVEDDTRRADFIQRGRQRAARFTWTSAAQTALAVLEDALDA